MSGRPPDPSQKASLSGPVTGRDVGVVIPAAGSGVRMGGARKAHLELLGEPLLRHALRPFLDHPAVGWISVALHPEDAAAPPHWLRHLDERIRIVRGGGSRGESVRAALEALSPASAIVAVHDAARPLVDRDILERCFSVARSGVGAVAGWPQIDTLKEVSEDGDVLGSPDRSRYWTAQTPQVFPGPLLMEAYAAQDEDAVGATDDAALVARRGGRVRMVRGNRWNLKITHPTDLAVAEHLLRLRAQSTPKGEGG